MSCRKGLTTQHADYVSGKCKNEEVIGTEQVSECNSSNQKSDLKLNFQEYTMINYFKLYNVHTKYVEIEKWSILMMNTDYV